MARGVDLREGDLFLTRYPDVISAISALHIAGGAYSHAMMLTRDTGGAPVLVMMQGGGFEAHPLHEYLPRYARVAIARLRDGNADSAARLGAAARRWLERAERERVQFQLDTHNDGLKQGAFNCLGLLNRMHREEQLPEPFVRTAPRPRDAWTEAAARFARVDLERMPTTQHALENPAFVTVAEGWNPAVDRRTVAGQEEIADAFHGYIVGGRIPRRPRLGTRLWLGAARRCGAISGFTRQLAEARAVFLDFAGSIEASLADYVRRYPDVDEETVRRVVRRRCEELRDRYFRPEDD